MGRPPSAQARTATPLASPTKMAVFALLLKNSSSIEASSGPYFSMSPQVLCTAPAAVQAYLPGLCQYRTVIHHREPVSLYIYKTPSPIWHSQDQCRESAFSTSRVLFPNYNTQTFVLSTCKGKPLYDKISLKDYNYAKEISMRYSRQNKIIELISSRDIGHRRNLLPC